jgi:hypothetical protein
MEDENVDLNGDETVTTEWIGNQVAFNIGDRPVKIWELLLGIVVLAIILPLLIGGRGGGAGSSQGVTIVNTGAGQSAPRRRRTYKRRKRREIKSVTYK